jgi:aspartate oxidase
MAQEQDANSPAENTASTEKSAEDLTEILVKRSLATVEWMSRKGVRFTAAWGRQAFNIGGKFKFWGGLTVEAVGGGPGLVEGLTTIAKKTGVEIRYGARVISLLVDDDGVKGVKVREKGKTKDIFGKAIVLAAGGYPDVVETGKAITGLAAAASIPEALVFHAGTAKRDGQIVTSGGRVLTVVGRGVSHRAAIDVAYEAAGRIQFEGMQFRRDIGRKAPAIRQASQ